MTIMYHFKGRYEHFLWGNDIRAINSSAVDLER